MNLSADKSPTPIPRSPSGSYSSESYLAPKKKQQPNRPNVVLADNFPTSELVVATLSRFILSYLLCS